MSLCKITPLLWFNNEAEAAAEFYTSIFPNSSITTIQHYTDAGKEHHGREPGSVMVVEFTLLNGQHTFTALNGGPQFHFSEAISFQIDCEDQAEVDYYWDALADGGDESRQRCGWVIDRFGLAWQVIPSGLKEMLGDDRDLERRARVTEEMMEMKKLDVARLVRAYEGV
ncbi:putative 3-demethylubiquinone-9 3-methyltransferase [Aspergillus pseudodeflectus]|uniref:3-demethylubiquinone-9 3-methyltransferase n=1 Tax=Aspergillus pseudodeflectus TaxID=176178 RepID=A0ABR4KRS9_9EURO